MTQFCITGLDSEAMPLAVPCPRCKAPAGTPCVWKPAATPEQSPQPRR